MTTRPFPLPVVALGPGSQPDDPDLAYLPLPREIDRFESPGLPVSEDVAHLSAALDVVDRLISLLRGRDASASQAPAVDLTGLDAENRRLIGQLLGEGEVSARVSCRNGHRLDIQESVFAGVWRVLELDADGVACGDRIEAGPIPAAVWQEARAFGKPALVLPDPTQHVGLMNAAPVAAEIAEQMGTVKEGAAHVINFSLLPMSQADLAWLDALLGPGNSGVFSRGYGKCRVMATSLANVWRVQYFNGMNAILLDTVEITRIPEVTLASEDDLADSLERLSEARDWLHQGAA
jgi:hydrogenase-1 operon protein HyaF